MLRGGLIGLGNVAVHGHLPGWLERSDVELVAATDVRPGQRRVCRERLPGARWYESADALLADSALDFVDVCTPPSSHAPLVQAALRRGLHVLCEKPLVRSLEELAPVLALAERTDRVVHTVHNWHHAPIVQRAAELLRAGEIGQPIRVVWHTLRTKPAATGDSGDRNWRVDPSVAGGGVLSDHGWHVCYVIRRWLGAWPVAVSARIETRRHTASAVEDTAALRLDFPGAIADVRLTWAADERRNWAAIDGSSGRIEIDDDTLVLTARGAERRWACPPLSGGSHHPDWFGAVADGFVSAMRGGAAGRDNLAEAILCATVESRARESSRLGGATLILDPPPALAPARPACSGSI